MAAWIRNATRFANEARNATSSHMVRYWLSFRDQAEDKITECLCDMLAIELNQE